MIVKKALMILGEAQYDALNIFTANLAEGFRENGIKVDLIDTRENTTSLIDLYYGDYDLILSFNGMWDSTYTRAHRRNLNTVTWSFLVDHPLHHHTRLIQSHRNQIVSCVDRKHVSYVQKYYRNNPYVCYMPHGGLLTCRDKRFEDRRYDVSFFGSYKRPEEIMNEPEPYNDAMGALIDQTIDGLWSAPERSLEEEFASQLSNRGITVSDDEFRDFMKELGFIDRYIRNQRRHDVVEALISRGIRVDVFGNGWEDFETDYKYNLNIHGAISYEDSLTEMSESRIVLNTMPLFTDGSHERIFTIMGQRSICLTDKSRYLTEEFSDGEDLFFYSMTELEKLPGLVRKILNREYDVDRIIEKAYGLVKEHHLWRDRAKAILEYLAPVEIEEELVIEPQDEVDDAFCRLMQYVKQTEEQLLYERMKGNYLFYLETEPDYVQRLGNALTEYPQLGSWNPEEGDFGVIRKRVEELKAHMDKFIWLYQKLRDKESRSVLTNVLLNWETFDTKYLSRCVEGDHRHFDEDISEEIIYIKSGLRGAELDALKGAKNRIIREHPKLACSICYTSRNIWQLAEYIDKLDDTYRFYIRYYGNNLFPDGMILYAI